MRQLRIAGGLLLAIAMLVLGFAAASNLELLSGVAPIAAPSTATSTLRAATATATLAAYPMPNETPLPPPPTRTPVIYPTIGPKPTLPPKPTVPPTATPTITPIPTALAVPASAYEGLWVESVPNPAGSYPDNYDSLLWAADPRDIGRRRLVARFDRQNIYTVVVSPGGKQIAVTAGSNRPLGIPLYVLNADGSGLRQVAPNASRLLWSVDERTIAYTANRKPEQVDGSVIEIVDVPTAKQRRLATFDDEVGTLQILYWSADGQSVGITKLASLSQGKVLELWLINVVSAGARNQGVIPKSHTLYAASPDANSLLFTDWDTGKYALLDLSQLRHRAISLPPSINHIIWSADGGLLYFDEDAGSTALRKINMQTGANESLIKIRPEPLEAKMTAPVSLAPDAIWLVVFHYYTGVYVVYLPTGAVVPVPIVNTPLWFGGWVRK